MLTVRGRGVHFGRVLPRSTDVVSLVDTFVISAISSLMLVRLYLFLAGYPKVGGGGLHVAHMIWGGVLMLAALITAISFVSIKSRWMTALLGGLGFGLFIDEVGKFLTSDNNYFFRPAAALIYVIFIVIFLFARAITRRRDFSCEEYLANAVDILKEAAIHDFDQLEKRKLLHLLSRAGDSALAQGVRELLDRLEPPHRLSRVQLIRRALDRRYSHLARTTWFARLLAWLVVLGCFLAMLEVSVIILVRNGGATGVLDSVNFVGWLELVAAFVSLVFAGLGLLWDIRRPRGLRALERAVFVWILLIQPFAFYEAQFFASAGLLFSLPLLGAIQYAIQQETKREREAEAEAEADRAPGARVAG